MPSPARPNCLTIWNSSASKAAQAADVRRHLADQVQGDVVEPKSEQETADILERHLERGLDRLIVAGGDGTINSVVNTLAAHPHPPALGLLPLGTANDLCCSLGIPDDPLAALQLAVQGEPQPLDVIEVRSAQGSRYYANMATGGNSARVTESLTDDLKKRWGPLCYLRGAIGVLADLDVFEAEVTFDAGPAQTLSIWNILIANGRTCGGRVNVAPRARVNDGLMDVILVQDGTVADMAQMAAALLTGDYLDQEQVVFRQVKQLEIRSRPEMFFTLDGELLESVVHSFAVHAGRLQVPMTPAEDKPSLLEGILDRDSVFAPEE